MAFLDQKEITHFLAQELFYQQFLTLEGLNSGVPTRTTPTLTPTTLRNIEQTFIELQSKPEPHENEAGFVPPLVHSIGNNQYISAGDADSFCSKSLPPWHSGGGGGGGGYRGRSYSHSPMSSRKRHLGTRDNPKPSRCIGIFGLSVYTTEDELYHLMSKYGPLERVQVVIDAKTGRSRGFAFVYFESSEDAKVAKDQCTGMKINGKSIRVDFSITERPHTPTPGIYMGKPTYRERDRYDSRRRSDRDDYYYEGGRSSRRRRSPSPYYSSSRRRRYSRSRSYSPRRY